MAKLKVKNDNKFVVGIRYEDGTQRETILRAGAVLPMDEIDVMNIDASSQLFKQGILTVMEEKEVLESVGIEADNPNSITIKEIEAILKLNGNQMRNKLKDVTARHAIDKVISTAKEAELSPTKIKIINELYDINLFDEIGEELV